MPSPRYSARWNRNSPPVRVLAATAFGLCLLYRVAVIVQQAGQTDWLTVSMNALGIAFFLGALYAWRYFGLAGFPATLYLLLQAMHWGGPLDEIGAEPYPLLLYLLLSSVLASTFLLHFALDLGGLGRPRPVIYLPAIAMLSVFPLVVLDLADPAESVTTVCLVIGSVLYPLAATILFLRFTWRTDIRNTVLLWLTPVAVASVAPVVPGVDVLGKGYEPLNLLYVAQIMVVLAIARYRHRRRE